MKTNTKLIMFVLVLGSLLMFSSGCKYYFPWYDWQSPGMNGNWILLGNVSPISKTTATVTIEGVKRGDYPLASREVKAPSYPGLMGGPVIIEGSEDIMDVAAANDQSGMGAIIASQRVIYKDSFNEIQGNFLNSYSDGWFSWYDLKSEGMKGDWILVGNASTNTAANVTITIGGAISQAYVIPPRGRITPFFPGVMEGPVHVQCTNGQEIFATQRVIYNDSFSEVWAIPSEIMSDKCLFNWYDQQSAGMNGDWIMVTNVSTGMILGPAFATALAPIGTDANVQIKIGDWTDPTVHVIPPGQTRYFSYPGRMGGPVRVETTNGVPIFTSQRVIYKDSFDENAGMSSYYPTTAWTFPWYDQQSAGMNGDWILVGNPSSDTAASVQVRIGIDAPRNMSVGPGAVGYLTFPGTMGGIVSVDSNIPVFSSQRVIYKDSFNESWSFVGVEN